MRRLLQILMAWTTLTTSVLWVLVLRCLFQPDYAWQLFGLEGRGLGGDLWVVALLVLFNGVLLVLGWWGALPPFHLMLLLWHWTLASVALTWTVRDGAFTAWRNDTFGLEIPAIALSLLLVASATAALIWVVIDYRRRDRRAPSLGWQPHADKHLIVALALFPAIFAFFYYPPRDEQHLALQVGSLLAAGQWCLLHYGVLRRSGATEPERARSLDTRHA